MVKLVLIVSAVMVAATVMAFPAQQTADLKEIPVRVVRAAEPEPGPHHHRGVRGHNGGGYGGGYGGGFGGGFGGGYGGGYGGHGGHGGFDHGGHGGHGNYGHHGHGGGYNNYGGGNAQAHSSAQSGAINTPFGVASFATANANAGAGGYGK